MADDGALVRQVLRTAEQVDQHRTALSSQVLMWWEGRAADAFRSQVVARAASLGRLSDELRQVAQRVRAAEQGDAPGGAR